MTYSDNEISTYNGKPYFLYEFTKGSTVSRFTSHSEDIVNNGNTYLKSPIRHQGIAQSGQVERVSIDILFPKSWTFAQTYFTPDYDSVQTVTIYRYHHGTTGFEVMWKGRVVMYEANYDEIKLICESIQTTLRRSGLRGKFQKTCRHALYGSRCGLDINNWYINATVDSVDGLDVTLSFATADEKADGYFKGGIINKNGSLSFIKSDVSNVVTLQYVIEGLVATDSVLVAPGCDLSISTCVNKFDNVDSFGGTPYVPTRNPFGGPGGTRVD